MTAEFLDLFPDDARDDFPVTYLDKSESGVRLSSVRIENFKALHACEVELPEFAVLTGVNNSGKTSILQAIWLAFECLRLCVDREKWSIPQSGRILLEFGFLPVNEIRDMWYKRRYRSGNTSVPIRIEVRLADGVGFRAEINHYFGGLNVRVDDVDNTMSPNAVKEALLLAPLLIPGHVELTAHEETRVPAQIHRLVQSGQLSSVMRNVLLSLVPDGADAPMGLEFVRETLRGVFGAELGELDFNEEIDLDIRAPYEEGDVRLDIVSGGSGFHQILKLLAFAVWKRSKVLLLDEPDAHLHSSLQGWLCSFLNNLSRRFSLQVILATHARDLISAAPLQAIIPVEAEAKKLLPIASIEHLLDEYRRLGPLTNVDIALLYQTRRCLFVEGESDKDYLPLVASVLGYDLFKGPNQFVIFRFNGVEKFHMVKDLVDLFRELTGGTLTWYVLRDRDTATPQIMKKLHEQAQMKGIGNYHVWERYSWENYLLDPRIVHRAVSAVADRRDKTAPSLDDVVALLGEASSGVLTSARPTYITDAQSFYVRNDMGGDRAREAATKDALEHLDRCRTPEGRLEILPGAVIFGRMVQMLQQEHHINLRLRDLIEWGVTPQTASAELLGFFDTLVALC